MIRVVFAMAAALTALAAVGLVPVPRRFIVPGASNTSADPAERRAAPFTRSNNAWRRRAATVPIATRIRGTCSTESTAKPQAVATASGPGRAKSKPSSEPPRAQIIQAAARRTSSGTSSPLFAAPRERCAFSTQIAVAENVDVEAEARPRRRRRPIRDPADRGIGGGPAQLIGGLRTLARLGAPCHQYERDVLRL